MRENSASFVSKAPPTTASAHPSPEGSPPPRLWLARAAGVGWAVAWILTVLLAAGAVMRLMAHDRFWPFLLFDVLTPYVYLPAWVIVAVALLGRRWRLGIAAGTLAALHVHWTLLPMLPRTPPPIAGPSLKIVSANLLMVHDDPPKLAAELDRLDADIYFLQEVSARWDEELERRGFWARLPFNRRVVSEDSFGCAIASRLPVRDLDVFWLAELPEMRGVLTFDGRDIELLTVHLLPPRTSEYVPYFHAGADGIVARVRSFGNRPFILAGDFNATPDSRFAGAMRPLGDDLWELAGTGGLGATWPNGVFPVPPVRLDHVFLSRDLTAADVAIGVGAGSDHRPLSARIGRRLP